MKKFNAQIWVVLGRELQLVQIIANDAAKKLVTFDPDDRAEIEKTLASLASELLVIGASETVVAAVRHLGERCKDMSPAYLGPQVVSICNLATIELGRFRFFSIDPDKRQWLEDEAPFGSDIATTFPDAMDDIKSAARCFALEQPTACIFHLMRAAEVALHKVAHDLGIENTELENWKNVIDQVERKIREMEALPKTPEKSAALRRWSEAALQMRFFKDAWRNHVSHSRVHYDIHQARSVLDHVKGLFRLLST